jgi:hypothetical protein
VSKFHDIWWTITQDPLLGDLSSCREHVLFYSVLMFSIFLFNTLQSIVFSIFLHF